MFFEVVFLVFGYELWGVFSEEELSGVVFFGTIAVSFGRLAGRVEGVAGAYEVVTSVGAVRVVSRLVVAPKLLRYCQ